jgi:predicted CxxxxCH...CXXCH cytochrome family protein
MDRHMTHRNRLEFQHPAGAAQHPAGASLVACAALLLALSGCDNARSLPAAEADAVTGDVGEDVVEVFAAECRACHGNIENPAPPNAIGGKTETTWRGVGAHQTHVRGTNSNNAVACKSCHTVPENIFETGHMDAADHRAIVKFDGLALANGATPIYDPETLTCSNVYCHGSKTKVPGKNSSPVWTLVDSSQRSCDSCHGAPPALPHPQKGDCIECHAGTAGPNKTIANKANHINGKVDIVLGVNTKCDGCHGAPPVSAKHPVTTAKCEGCHATTVDANQEIVVGGTHMNGKTDVVLSGSAPCSGCHGAPPVSDKHPKTLGKCEGCHTTTVDADMKIIAGGTHNNGKVDVALGADADCAGCHAFPPVSDKHPKTLEKCEGCHTTTVDTDNHIVSGGTHNNGKVDVTLSNNASCVDCHVTLPNGPGSAKHPATTAATICAGCHATSVDAQKHVIAGGVHNNGKEDVVLGPLADCAGCHDALPNGPGKVKHPITTPLTNCEGCHTTTLDAQKTFIVGGAHQNGKEDVVLGADADCAGCHKAPPIGLQASGGTHPATTAKCEGCHTTTVDVNKQIVPGGTHMDGQIEVALSDNANCVDCHKQLPDPPGTAKHPVTDANTNCEGCHTTTVNTQQHIVAGGTHMNDKIDVALGADANCAGCHGAPPVSDKHPVTDADCSGCHSSTAAPGKQIVAGGTHLDGKIDVVLSSSVDCAGCHGAPPNNGKHPMTLEKCEGCHATTVDANKQIIAGGTHQDGKIDVVLAPDAVCNACHGAPPVSAKHPVTNADCEGCHTTTVAVGKQLIPGGTHFNGVVDVVLSANADCSACHGAPPTVNNHPQSTACETCHALTAGPNETIANAANHRNGKVEIKVTAAADCNACHLTPPNNGKHPQLQPIVQSCHLCHASSVGADDKPLTDGTHANGTIEFALAPTDCVSCHGAPPVKPEHPKMNNCNKCHSTTVDATNTAIVAGGAHVNGTIDVVLPTACNACHGSADSAAPPPDVNGNTDPTLPSVGAHAAHLNGKNFSAGGMTCDTCHELPKDVSQTGHLTGTLDSVKFPNGKAVALGLVPMYDPASMTCSNIYCHGATLPDGALKAPIWNKPWTQPATDCGNCHGIPPGILSGHPPVDPSLGTKACALCHAKTINADGTLNTKDGWHINGLVNP